MVDDFQTSGSPYSSQTDNETTTLDLVGAFDTYGISCVDQHRRPVKPAPAQLSDPLLGLEDPLLDNIAREVAAVRKVKLSCDPLPDKRGRSRAILEVVIRRS